MLGDVCVGTGIVLTANLKHIFTARPSGRFASMPHVFCTKCQKSQCHFCRNVNTILNSSFADDEGDDE